MAKGDLKREGRSGLDTVNGTDAENARIVDEGVYGPSSSLDGLDTGRLVAKPINIYEIFPDPKQPRRQIPSIIRQQWDGYADTVAGMFSIWAAAFAEESGRHIDEIGAFIDQILEGDEVSPAEVYQGEQIDPKRQWGVIGGSLMAVVNLAAEIRRDGLTNPITVVRVGNQFVIETGERRWLAFHLLNIFRPDSVAWERIPARAIPASSVWRQASENTARAQLNAISMARQLAILLMDLYGNDRFQAYDELVQPMQCDRAYYAQVDDGNVWRVPRGKGEQLVNAMGITNPVQLRQYRYLLRLPDEAWMLADDLNWTEFFIRSEIVEKAANESGVIALAQRHAYEAGYRVTDSSHTVTVVTVSDDETEPAREEVQDDDADDEIGQPEIQVGNWVKTKVTGDELFQVIEIIPKDGWNQWVPLYRLHNDQMPEGAEMKAQRSDLVLVEPLAQGSDDPPASEIEPLAAVQLKILSAAYKFAANGALWISAANIGAAPETLNRLAAQGLLQTKNEATNVSYTVAHYRIAAPGCAAIKATVIAYQQETPTRLTPPRSGADVHAGAGGNGNTPPVQNNPDPDREQRQREKRIEDQLVAIVDQLQFSAERVPADKVLTEEGHAMVKRELQRIFDIARSIRERLPNTKKSA